MNLSQDKISFSILAGIAEFLHINYHLYICMSNFMN